MTTPDSAFAAVQTAVYSALTGDQALRGLVSGVYDEVPEDAGYPYVVLGEALEQPDNRHGTFGRQTVITLHVWSKSRGFAEAHAIVSRLVALLDHQPLTVPGRRHVVTRYEFSQTLRDPEPHVRHIPIRFRILTEQE